MLARRAAYLLLALWLSACASAPPSRPGPTQPPAVSFALEPVSFSDLPGWSEADLAPALGAFLRSCSSWMLRAPEASLTGGRYGGAIAHWRPACAAAETVRPGQERGFFEGYFEPARVRGEGERKLTAYYEPTIEARRSPAPGFTEPFLRRPSDMVSIDIAAFAEAHDNEALRGAPRALMGQVIGNRVQPYPKREAISPAPGQAFAWAHPADLYNLQVQGSGRLAFPDGAQSRAAYAAQNGYRWRSALGALRDSGELQGGASWANFKAWMNARDEAAARAALHANPSYVFFEEEAIADPSLGARGAANVPLTPQGSLAVDPAYHPYGAIIFVEGTYEGAPFRRLLVAQDTGGAIRRGPLRGDVFWGSGASAGAAAERMNAPAEFWTLLPRGAAMADLLTSPNS